MGTLIVGLAAFCISHYRRPLTPYHHDWRRAFLHERLVTLGLLYACTATALLAVAVIAQTLIGPPRL